MKADFEYLNYDDSVSVRYFFLIKKYFEFYWHYHPEIELTCILSGEGTRLVGDHIGIFRENDLVLLAPNVPHSWESRKSRPAGSGQNKALVVQFATKILTEGVLNLPEFEAIGHLLEEAEGGIRFTGQASKRGREMLLDLNNVSGFRRLTGLFEVLDFLARTGEWVRLSSDGYRPSLNRKIEQRLDRVLYYIHSAYNDPISLADLAGIAGMNESAFSRFFRTQTGKSPVMYLNEVRIRQVCQMLVHSREPVGQIAFNCGFNNLTHFNRQFRKLNKCSPVDYRKMRAGRDRSM